MHLLDTRLIRSIDQKPSSKAEKNKPKGGKAKDEKRKAEKEKAASKLAKLF